MSDVTKMYIREVAVGMTIFVCLILMACFTVRGAYATYKAGINRKPGYSFRTAANPQSLLFRDAPYTDEGKKWCATFQRCFFGWLAMFILFWIAAWIGSGR